MQRMNKKLPIAVSLLIAILISIISFSQPATKIACIGNSITWGYGMVNREKNNYPAQLQAMLGAQYQVRNFAVSGTTFLKKGNAPYWKTTEYKQAIQYNPGIVFIHLNASDSFMLNRQYFNKFEKDYTELVQSFRQLASHPRIVLLLPLPSFATDTNQITNPVIKEQIIPIIQKLAYQTGCEIINLYSLFVDKEDLMPDKIHPSSLGATLIAKRLYEVVKLDEKKSFDIFSKIKEKKEPGSFYGFECVDFTFNNRNCKIVKPKKAAIGLPWIWRARFWGHEPQTDIALLERGFHLVYCDVAELFGNSEAIELWNRFYAYMQECHLAKKVVLEGMSRGGVYMYNWALANHGKVAAVYADAPVLDLKSWPGGKGKSAGSKADWEVFKTDYGLTEEQAVAFTNSPLDNAEKIAGLNLPILHVVGDADDVVPVDENTSPFEAKILEAGGNITVIHKPGVNHHPHSLANPTPIVDFILQATGYKTKFAFVAAPGSEYRSAAGWKEGTDWWTQNDDINNLLKNNLQTDIVFIGNSITQGIGGERPSVSYKPGKVAFDKSFGEYSYVSAGISGDRTQNVLWRLQNGSYATAHPKVAVLTIGVNNFADDPGEEVAMGIHEILKWMKKGMPSTKIILIGPLPAGLKKEDVNRKKYEIVQSLAKKENGGQVIYLPVAASFIKQDGDLNLDYYSGDGIHLVEKGYELWASLLKEAVEKIVKQ